MLHEQSSIPVTVYWALHKWEQLYTLWQENPVFLECFWVLDYINLGTIKHSKKLASKFQWSKSIDVDY